MYMCICGIPTHFYTQSIPVQIAYIMTSFSITDTFGHFPPMSVTDFMNAKTTNVNEKENKCKMSKRKRAKEKIEQVI